MPLLDSDPQTHSWHIDRRIPLALIYTIVIFAVVQSGGALVWAVTMSNRVASLEQELASRQPIIDRFITIEARVNAQSVALDSRLNRIEDKLDRLIENGVPARRLPGP